MKVIMEGKCVVFVDEVMREEDLLLVKCCIRNEPLVE